MRATGPRGTRVYVFLFFVMFALAVTEFIVATVRIGDLKGAADRATDRTQELRDEMSALQADLTIKPESLRDADVPERLLLSLDKKTCDSFRACEDEKMPVIEVEVGHCDGGALCVSHHWLDGTPRLVRSDTYWWQSGRLRSAAITCHDTLSIGNEVSWRFDFHPTAAVFDTAQRRWKVSAYQAKFSLEKPDGNCSAMSASWAGTGEID
ncbi:hypothetical protein [Sphaerimonospora thailandensis]|uniref:Uncharacterized protein n=1 Tax=Sphaerimonospora thailandensis TaxID=795644 RepID=A0A8J3RB85_9ACTN|nr:hypothetical protein [Sphaerimonospora thailandensis]GIH72502.1 hypothetical protein Mth01_47550 [Sphaerimonospora thailandensis]